MNHGLENIFLIRHLQSLRNLGQGGDIPDCNVPLTPEGREQSAVMGDRLGVLFGELGLAEKSVRVWCSPYLRTRQSRDITLGKISRYVRDSREDVLLTEWNFGLFDGLTEAERFAKYPNEAAQYAESIRRHGKYYARPLNGESWQDVCIRVRQFFGTITRDAEKADPVKNIAVFSHGLTIRAFVMMWLHLPVEWMESEKNPGNASVRRIGRDKDGKWHDFGNVFPGFAGEPPVSTGEPPVAKV